MKILRYLILFIGLAFFSTNLLANEKSIFFHIDFTELSFHDAQTLRKEVLGFLKEVDKKTTFEKNKKTVFYRYWQSLNAYAADEICFFAGWPSQMISGICKNPQTHGRQSSYMKEKYSDCPGGLYRCSPVLFGANQCVGLASSAGLVGLTQSCENESKKTPGNIAQVASKIKNKPEEFKALANEIDQFCLSVQEKYKQKDHQDTCKVLTERVAKIQDPIKAQKKLAEKIQDNLIQNKALGILDQCRGAYDKDNEGFLAGLVKSDRKIFEQLQIVNPTCRGEMVAKLESTDLESLKESLKDVGEAVLESELLETMNTRSLENGVEAYLKFILVNENDQFFNDNRNLTKLKRELVHNEGFFGKGSKGKSFKDRSSQIETALKKAATKLKKKKIKKISLTEKENKLKKFASVINLTCKYIRVEVEKKYPKDDQEHTSQSTLQEEQEKIEKEYTKHANNAFFAQIQHFSNTNPDLSNLMYTDEFQDTFPFGPDIGEKCANGDIDMAINESAISFYNIANAQKDLKKTIVKDLKKTDESLMAFHRNDQDDIQDQIREYLKYKPYLLKNFFNNSKLPTEEKEFYAQYVCKETLSIYNSDEKWNMGYVGAGVAIGVAASVIAPTVGASLLWGIGSAAIEAAVIVARETQDADEIIDGATVGVVSRSIDSKEFNSRKEIAEGRKTNAILSAVTVPTAGAGHIVGKIGGQYIKNADNFVRTKKVLNSTSNVVKNSVGRVMAASNASANMALKSIKESMVKITESGNKLIKKSNKALKVRRERYKQLPQVSNKELKTFDSELRLAVVTKYLRDNGKLKTGKSLTLKQKRAIISAHKVGGDEVGIGWNKLATETSPSDHNFQFRHIKDKYLAMVGKNPKKPLFDKDTIQWMMDNGITGHRILKNVSTAKGKELNALEVEAAELADKLKKAITKETDLSRHANKSKDGVASIHERDIIDLKKAKEERNVIEKRLREVKNIKDPLREELRLEIVSKKDFIRNSLNIGKDNPQLADADWRKFENLSAKDLAKRGLTGDEIDELLVDKTIPGITNLRSLTDEIRLAEETLAQNKLILEQFKPKKSASAGRIQVKNSDKTREIQINKSDEFSPEETQKLIRFQNDDLELRIQELQLARLPYRRREVSWAKKQNEFRENQRIRHKAIQTEKETIQKRIDENKNHLWSDEYRDITQIVNNLRRSGGSYSWRKPDSSYITIYNDRSLNTSDEAQSLIAKLQNIVSNKSVIEAVISEDELALKTITDEADQIQKLLKEQGYPIK